MSDIRRSTALSWLFEGTYSGDEKRKHLIALRRLQPHEDDSFEHDHLYACLSILDNKAQGLLSYDSIVLAAASLVLSIFPREISAASVLVFMALIFSGMASSLCLFVIWIFWTETPDLADSQALFTQLLSVRNRRTIAYRLAWVMAQASMILLVVGVLLQRMTG